MWQVAGWDWIECATNVLALWPPAGTAEEKNLVDIFNLYNGTALLTNNGDAYMQVFLYISISLVCVRIVPKSSVQCGQSRQLRRRPGWWSWGRFGGVEMVGPDRRAPTSCLEPACTQPGKANLVTKYKILIWNMNEQPSPVWTLDLACTMVTQRYAKWHYTEVKVLKPRVCSMQLNFAEKTRQEFDTCHIHLTKESVEHRFAQTLQSEF